MKILIVTLGSILALAFAFYFQYIRGLHPCELCILQRWGYAAVIVVFLASVIPAKAGIQPRRWIPAFAGMTITFLLGVEIAIAIYHTGIEQHWWEGFTSCSSAIGGGSLEEIKAKLMNTPLVRCDEPQWYFVGLSMAAWNAVYASILFIISLSSLSSSGLTRGSSRIEADPRVKPEDDKGRQ